MPSPGKKPQASPGSLLIGAFGSAALSRAIVEHLRRPAATSCTVLTPLALRVPDLRALLEAEGVGEARVLTLAAYAAELAGHPGPTALTAARRWLLFHKALFDAELPGQWKTLVHEGQGIRTLYQLLESLRANFIRSEDLEPLASKHPVAGLLAELLGSFECNLRDRDIADLTNVIQAAIEKIKHHTSAPPGLCVFDLMHEARPDEFELAVALAQTGTRCLFFCDPGAPAPAGRAVVKDIASELSRRLPGLPSESATPSSNEALGKKIAAGSLSGGTQLLAFNDLASELRGLAQTARTLMVKEGVPAGEICFFVAGGDTQVQLLRCELQHAQILQETLGHLLAANALEREARLLLGLLRASGPQSRRAGEQVNSRNKIPARLRPTALLLYSGVADELQLARELAKLISQVEKKATSLEKLFESAAGLLLPDLTEVEKDALALYFEAAKDFAILAGTGEASADLPGFVSALGGYLEQLSLERCDLPPAGLRPAEQVSSRTVAVYCSTALLRNCSVMFLPSLVANAEPARRRLPGIPELAGALERKLGRPVFLPRFHGADRERWEYGTAAAAGAKVILSYHRQKGGRRVEPLPWLQRVPGYGIRVTGCGKQKLETRNPTPETVSNRGAVGDKVTVPPVLSVTAIGDYISCPHLFYLRRLLKLKEPRSERMSLGSLLHEVLARFHAPGETDFSLERIRGLIEGACEGRELIAETLDEAGKLLEAYVPEQAAFGENTVATERRFELHLGGAKVFGRIDRIVAAGGGVKVIDYKTSGTGKERKHKNAAVARLEDIQLPLYTLAAREMGHTVQAFSYIYLDYEKTSMPREVPLRFSEDKQRDAISEAELAGSLARIEGVVREMLAGCIEYGKGEGAPCRRQSGWCSFSAMCSFAGEA
jgi:CRISPR/Cas system-associated exonuclease Cas4 (RecB family)